MQVPKSNPADIDAISERLMLTRRAKNLNKTDFPRRAGISPTAYHNWEPAEGTPPVGRPDIDQAYALCVTYDLTMDWIYCGVRSHLPYELVEAIEAVEKDLGMGRFKVEPLPQAPLASKKRA